MASAAASSAASIKGDDVTSTFTEDPSARRAEMLSLPSSGALSMDSEATSEEPSDRLQRMADACRTLLVCLGEDPDREGLLKTPMRMAKSLVSLTSGYAQEPAALVAGALFECESDELVVVRDIDVYSMCEHHMLPFFGHVHIGYLPRGRVIGLSKLARLTDCFAKRLQIQERLTRQIADAVQACTGARGVAVILEATHMCMTMRGVAKPGSLTQSAAYTGEFSASRELRSDFAASVRSSPLSRQ